MKSVDKKLDFLSFKMVVMISLLMSTDLAATRERIEKHRKASCTDSVPSAESASIKVSLL